VPPGKARLNEWGVFFRRSPQQAKTKKGYSRLMSPNRSQIHNDNGESPFVLVADHAGNLFPRALGHLGLSSAESRHHIAWDIGIGEVARIVGAALQAKLVRQNYSRLIIDCNRPPDSPTSIPEQSEFTAVPGNVGLTKSQRAERERDIFWPYHHEKGLSVDSGSATCCGLNERIRSVAGTTIDGQRAFAFAISGSVF